MFGAKRLGVVGVAGGLCFATLLSVPGPAMAAHNGNNRAEIRGTGDPDAAGRAIINYSKGRGDFNGNITVSNLEAGETYQFSVLRDGTFFLICAGTANAQGLFTCSAQHFVLPGFAIAVVRDSAGIEVARGIFERRGNCRDPEQERSLCEAPGHNK